MSIPNGYVRTEDLVVGDVVAHEGKWRVVTGLALDTDADLSEERWLLDFDGEHDGNDYANPQALWRLRSAGWTHGGDDSSRDKRDDSSRDKRNGA